MEVLPAAFFERDSPDLAALLLNKIIATRIGGAVTLGRIVETEAYREDDPASHTFGGRTARNAVMFGPPGHLYVYLSYGIHRCANVVADREGRGAAVLLRAVHPLAGLDSMRTRRPGRRDVELANGPGKLCAALGIELEHDGVGHTVPGGSIEIGDDGTDPPSDPLVGPRVGISKAVDTPWRFRVTVR